MKNSKQTLSKESLRPLYFFVVIWGERYLDYLTEYCIPSLLSSNNIPALAGGKKNKFIFCITRQEWMSLQQHDIFLELSQYITPVFMEIPYPDSKVPPCIHMGIGHKLATNLCFQDKAYGIALTPDLVISDGTFRTVEQHALMGKQIVFCAALRFSEEAVMQGFKQNSLSENTVLTGKKLVEIGMQSLHSETLRYDFDSPCFAANAPACYWRVPSDDGMVLHSMSWCPLLLDYSILKDHSTKTLDEWTLDGDYVYQNFQSADQIHVCTDSDEMMLLSWGPEPLGSLPLKPSFPRKLLSLMHIPYNIFIVKGTLCHSMYDPLKVKLFQLPVRWHIGQITPEWQKFEAKVQHFIPKGKTLTGTLFNRLHTLFERPYNYCIIIGQAIFGNQEARRRITVRLKRLYYSQ